MAVSHPPLLIDELTDFLVQSPTPQQIIDFKLSEQIQAHASLLLEKNREGTLTYEEREQMLGYLQMEHFISVLKVKAKRKLPS